MQRANCVDLEAFLNGCGERLLCSGKDKRLASDHSITIRRNTWFDHSAQRGGLAVSFIEYHFGQSFPDAVLLLNGQKDKTITAKATVMREPLPFTLPHRNDDMRRLFAYLVNERCIDREIVAQAVCDRLIYESSELSENGKYEYHNAVFVGVDEHGIARHAHKTALKKSSFCINVEGSKSEYSFHRISTSNKLYVFEAPIDLLSYICLHLENWMEHNYVALCGMSEYVMMKALELNKHISDITLCLDNDKAGIASTERLDKRLRERGYENISVDRSDLKDWNEDMCATRAEL